MYNYLRPTDTRYSYVLLIVLSLPALYAYNPLPLYFLNDDFIHVPLSQEAVWGQRNSIRPINDVTLYLNSLAWGNNAAGYHFTNLIIHAVNSVLVFFLAGQVFQRIHLTVNSRFWCFSCVLLFWGHAFHSESVLWVIGRSGCLSSLFFLICLIIFLSRKRHWYFFLLSYLCFFLGLLTYESIFILPPALIVLAFFYKDLRRKVDILLIAGYCILFIYYLFLRIQWTGEIAGSYEGNNITQFNITLLITNYGKLFVRSFVAPQTNSLVFLVSAFVFFLLVFVLYIKQVKNAAKDKRFFPFLLIFLLSYLPYISLGIDTHGVEAERYLYLPSIFVCILLIVFFAAFKKQQWAMAFFFLYFLYNQYYLLKSSNAFVVASDITKKTMQLVINNQAARTIYFKNLPKENYGVTILRLGLEEGVNWQTNNATISQKLKIVSFNEDELFTMKTKLTFVKMKASASYSFTHFYERDLNSGTDYVLSKSNALFDPAVDVLIEYTDKNIIVYKGIK